MAETVQTSTIFKHFTDLPLGKWLGKKKKKNHIGVYWKPCDQAENFLMKRLWPEEMKLRSLAWKQSTMFGAGQIQPNTQVTSILQVSWMAALCSGISFQKEEMESLLAWTESLIQVNPLRKDSFSQSEICMLDENLLLIDDCKRLCTKYWLGKQYLYINK